MNWPLVKNFPISNAILPSLGMASGLPGVFGRENAHHAYSSRKANGLDQGIHGHVGLVIP
jgi:hypothetical protein